MPPEPYTGYTNDEKVKPITSGLTGTLRVLGGPRANKAKVVLSLGSLRPKPSLSGRSHMVRRPKETDRSTRRRNTEITITRENIDSIFKAVNFYCGIIIDIHTLFTVFPELLE